MAVLAALALAIRAAPARPADTASLQILQRCVAATAPGARRAPALRETAAVLIRRGRPANPEANPDADPDADLTARCPDLTRALADLGLATQIDVWNGKLDHDALEDLLRMAQRYEAPMPSAAPSVATLPLALARLQTPPTPPRSWWQALEERIEQWLGQPGAQGVSWLEQLLRQLSIAQWVAHLILYVTTAAVLLMAVWVIWREARAAGLLGPRATRRGVSIAPAAVPAGPMPAPAPGLGCMTDVERSPLAERSIVLLRLLVQALLQSGRLSSERALTYRELGECGDFDDPQQRGRFARLAHLAERDRYGVCAAQPDEWPAVAREGTTLYAQLLAPRRPERATGAADAADAAVADAGNLSR